MQTNQKAASFRNLVAACQGFKQLTTARVIGALENQGCLLVVGFSDTIGDLPFNLILKMDSGSFSIHSINVESKVLLKTWVNIDSRLQVHSETILGEVSTTHSSTGRSDRYRNT